MQPKVDIVVEKAQSDKSVITIQPKEDIPHHFFIKDLKNATAEFRRCIDDGKYKGVVEITAIITDHVYSASLELDSR